MWNIVTNKCNHSRVQYSLSEPAVSCQTPETGISNQALLADRRERSTYKITYNFINAKRSLNVLRFLAFSGANVCQTFKHYSLDRNNLRRDLSVNFLSTLPSNGELKLNGIWIQLQVHTDFMWWFDMYT